MKNKPVGCCYPNCFDCPLDDCHYDIEETENELAEEIAELEVMMENVKATNPKGQNLKKNSLYQKLYRRYNYLTHREEKLLYQNLYNHRKRKGT